MDLLKSLKKQAVLLKKDYTDFLHYSLGTSNTPAVIQPQLNAIQTIISKSTLYTVREYLQNQENIHQLSEAIKTNQLLYTKRCKALIHQLQSLEDVLEVSQQELTKAETASTL